MIEITLFRLEKAKENYFLPDIKYLRTEMQKIIMIGMGNPLFRVFGRLLNHMLLTSRGLTNERVFTK